MLTFMRRWRKQGKTLSFSNNTGISMNPLQLATYLFLAVTWGFSFLMVLHVVDAFDWAAGVTFRCLLAALLLIIFAKLTGRKLNFSGERKHYAIVGATTVAGQLVFLYFSVPLIGTAMTAIFVAAIPLFSMLISQMWGLEKISARGFVGISLGFFGILMLVGFPSEPITFAFFIGCASSFLAAFFAAYGSNYVSRHMRDVGAFEVTIASAIIGSLLVAPLIYFVPIPRTITLIDVSWLLLLAAIVSGLNYVLYFRLVAEIGATKTISVEFLVTVVAVIVGTAMLGEVLTALQIAGACTIIAGCAMVLGLFRPKEPDIHA
jgi:drug/metabolite transporter (DMT)-like permease